jgi:cell wall-associated NlpC family hydrolase
MFPRRRRLLPAFVLAAAVAAAALPVQVGAEPPSPISLWPPDPPQHPDPRPPQPPTKGERAARIALEAVGVPYRWGGTSPATGFDCSGLVRWAYGRVGVDLPHSSYALYGEGRRVATGAMDPGDVLFFEGLGHVGLYLGEGRMVHAPYTGRNVEVVRLAGSNYGRRLVAARRVAAA